MEDPSAAAVPVDFDPFADGELATWAPSTQAQLEIWSAAQLSPEASLANNESLSLTCRGAFDGPAMNAALDGLWRRHEALRASFSADGQQLTIAEPSTLAVRQLDLSARSDQEAAVADVLRSEVTTPFDLARGPLFRATVVRLDPERHRVILSAHHIVCDGWSFGVLIADLAVLYSAQVAGRAAELPPAGRFSEWATAERETPEDPDDQRYWMERYAAPLPVLDLPTDRPRPRMRTTSSERVELDLPAELVTRLRKAGAPIGGASLFTTLFAGFSCLLHRLTGERDMALGVPAAGQMASGQDNLVGHCANILPIRVEVDPDQRFLDLLKAQRRHVLDAYDHQRHSLGSLMSRLRIPRDPSRVALVPLLFNLDAGLESPRGPHFGGLDVEVTINPRAHDNFEVSMNCMETRAGLRLQWNYNPDLFDAATARERVAGFATLLEAVADDPTRPIRDLPLLSPNERRAVLALGAADRAPASDATVHALFAARAHRAPDQVAVSWRHLQLTAGELDRRADALAALLSSEGLSSGEAVGLLAPAGLDPVVAALAVLKSGGVLLPLDPRQPAERIALLLEDAGAKLVLTQAPAGAALPPGVRALSLEELTARAAVAAEAVAAGGTGPLTGARGADDDAFLLYVTGGDSRPLGVRVPHRAITRFGVPSGAARMEPDEVLLALAPAGHPTSLFELFAPLLGGARLALLPDAEPPPSTPGEGAPWPAPDRLASLIRDSGATTLHLSAPRFHALVDDGVEALTPLRKLHVDGDFVSRVHLRKARAALPTVSLVRTWGTAECGPCALAWPVQSTGDSSEWPEAVPLGRPAWSTAARILDARLADLPVGIPGTLFVGGDGLASGYHEDREETARRFVHDPAGGAAAARLFDTGLRARRLPSGQLETLGPVDSLVELRGYRFLPREIEVLLDSHPSVHESVVRLREDRPGEPRLVAWVALEGGAADAEDLRAYLAARLPDFMVPSAVVTMPALPRHAGGDVDTAGLPAPVEGSGASGGFVAPRSLTEQLLAGIWAEVLALPRVSVHDDFFALGGHSLPWTRMFARLGKAFQVELPLRVLFEARTVAQLAERVEQARRSGGSSGSPPPLTARPRSGPPPLSYAQERLWLLDQLHPGENTFNIATAVHLDGPLDLQVFERSMAEIVRRHEALRTTFARVDGVPRQFVQEPSFKLAVIDLTGTPESAREPEARRIAAEDARRPFDLERGPLFRATVIRLGERSHLFLTAIHHIVSDGWSHGNMGEELAALYDAWLHGRGSPLRELPLQYADYAIWQREWLAAGVADEQIAYWRRQLEGAPAFLELPTVRPRPPVQTHHGAMHRTRLGVEQHKALAAHCGREGVTMFMLLLAAFQALLGRYTGQEDIVTGSPIAGRTRTEVDALIGFFLNTLALRTSLAGRPTFRELCARVRDVTLGAYGNQDIPFERLVEALAPQRDLSRTPLFQIYFNMLNLPPPGEALPGIAAQAWKTTDDVAKFDLDLYAEETTTGLELQLFYNTDLFDADQTRALLDHYVELLLGAVADPDRHLDELELSLPATCRPPELTVVGRPGPRFVRLRDEATRQSVGSLFARIAAEHGDGVAIRNGSETVTYAELDARTDYVAAALGSQPGRVALLFEPSVATITAMLGALKAGVTYVPLDVGSPEERLTVLLKDASPRALLVHGPTLDLARRLAPAGLPVMDVDSLDEAPPPETIIEPDTAAYILYTSGSTGLPKGVVQSHRNLLLHIRNYANRLHLSPGDALSLIASYAFDAAAMDIFGALLSGATLCPIDMRRSGLQHLPALLRQLDVTVYHSTPTVFRHLAGMLREDEVLDKVRLVVLGGEEAQARDVAAFRRHFPKDALLVNGLGPTESTLALQYFVDGETVIARDTVPVGFPVEDVDVRLVTPLGRQVAVWGVGQLELSAPQVALGYWNRPDLTAAAFSDDPSRPGARIYRTGDLARLLPGGALEYMGRADFQVKIRGHRVELGEIEARLLEHPSVDKAVVALRDGAAGEQVLVAWVVAAPARTPQAAELRAHLSHVLPPYMVPAAYQVLGSIPLLANGKVDRRALPTPVVASAGTPEGFVPPRDELEVAIDAIFCEVLGLRQVGLRDSFFDLGGHSMMAVRLVERIERTLGRKVPLIALFEAQTVEQLAAYLRAREASPQRSRFAVVPIRPTGHKRPLFLVSRPNVNALGFIALVRHLDPERPVYDIEGDHPDEWELDRPFSREEYHNWAASYVQAMRLIQPSGPYLLAGMCEGALIAFEMVRMLEADNVPVAFLGMFDAWPEENTRRPLLNRVWRRHNELRTLLGQTPEENARWLKHRFDLILGRLKGHSPHPVATPDGQPVESFDQRHFPGKGFVPPRVRTRITVFRVEHQRYYRISDEKLGWGNRTSGGVEVIRVPGEHTTILREPHAATLGPIVDEAVRRGEARFDAPGSTRK